MGTRVITLKLTATELLAVEKIMETGKYDSRSSLLRAGLGAIFERHKLDKSFDRQIEFERSTHTPRQTSVKRKIFLQNVVTLDDPDGVDYSLGFETPEPTKPKKPKLKKITV